MIICVKQDQMGKSCIGVSFFFLKIGGHVFVLLRVALPNFGFPKTILDVKERLLTHTREAEQHGFESSNP